MRLPPTPPRPRARPGLLSARRALGLACVLSAALVPPAAAQTTVFVAFGDSITEGIGDDPTRIELGYTPRLETLLRNAGLDVEVENWGIGGEDTLEGLSRIDEVLAGTTGDVLLLMEGTNDIARGIGIETTTFNLTEMARQAEQSGLSVVHATLIPRLPSARHDPFNVANQQLVERIRDLAGFRGRDLVDPFEVFGRLDDLYTRYYYQGEDDRVGHPNGAGYDVMARAYFEVLRRTDTVAPVTGVMSPLHGATDVAPGTPISVDLWDFGTGIDLASATLLVNEQPTGVVATGTPREAQLVYQPPAPLSGVVRVRLRARDLTTPTANSVDREVARFLIAGTMLLAGDIDRSGRVDGRDLVELARRFGRRRNENGFLAAADLNGDGSIDGSDLAVLASNFGRSI